MTDTTDGSQSKPGAPAVAFADQAPAASLATIRNLAWLVRKLFRASPRAAMLRVALAVVMGVVTPITLWASAGVANNLEARLGGGEGRWMWWFLAAWALVTAIGEIQGAVWGAVQSRVELRGSAAITRDVLAKVTRIDLASYEHQAFYDRFALILTNLYANARMILVCALQLGWGTVRLATWLGVLLVFDWRLALIAIVPLLPAIWGWFFTGTVYYHIEREQTRERRLATYYADLLVSRQAAKEVRLFGLAPTLIGRWEERYWETARDLRNRLLRSGLKQRFTSLVSISLAMLGFGWYITRFDGNPSAGTVVVVVASFVEMYGGIINFGRPIQELGKLAGFVDDLRTFLSLPEERDVRTEPAGPAPEASEVVLDHVTFTYPGATEPTLRDVSLRIGPGETVALVGENGAGKTTLVKLLLGLYRPDSGQILLDGSDLANASPDEMRHRLSGVFQNFTRYPLTLQENITLGETRLAIGVTDALTIVGMAKLPERLPNGLDTILSPDLGGVDLSGGQWQRIAIARAGIRDASLVTLDEPTAALDPLAEVAIFERFADLAADRTTILVSHRLGMARLADRIVCIEHGRIVEEGHHDDLVSRPGSRYAEMWEAQARWYR